VTDLLLNFWMLTTTLVQHTRRRKIHTKWQMLTRHSLISDGSIFGHLGDAKRAVFEQLFFYVQKLKFARDSFGFKGKSGLFLQ